MEAVRIAEGLWRWTAEHPNRETWPGHEQEAREVGCAYYEADDATVLVDPLVPAGEEDEFFRRLDADVDRRKRPVAILLTAEWHRRSTDELAERYGARVGGPPPAGVEEIAIEGADERQVAYFIRPHAALVVAEIFGADVDGRLYVAPSPQRIGRTSSKHRSTASWSCPSSGSSSRTASPSSPTRRSGWQRR